jgi:hypothetical protein
MHHRKYYLLEKDNEVLYSGDDFNTLIALMREKKGVYNLYKLTYQPSTIECLVQENVRIRASHGHTVFVSENEKKLYPVESRESTIRKLDLTAHLTAEEIHQLFKERFSKKRK